MQKLILELEEQVWQKLQEEFAHAVESAVSTAIARSRDTTRAEERAKEELVGKLHDGEVSTLKLYDLVDDMRKKFDQARERNVEELVRFAQQEVARAVKLHDDPS